MLDLLKVSLIIFGLSSCASENNMRSVASTEFNFSISCSGTSRNDCEIRAQKSLSSMGCEIEFIGCARVDGKQHTCEIESNNCAEVRVAGFTNSLYCDGNGSVVDIPEQEPGRHISTYVRDTFLILGTGSAIPSLCLYQ